MVRTTRAQREALKRVFDRKPLDAMASATDFAPNNMSYWTFRRRVMPGPSCIMVQWCGMWLGIEPDGYTHS